jgi:precorrin-6B methylase 2
MHPDLFLRPHAIGGRFCAICDKLDNNENNMLKRLLVITSILAGALLVVSVIWRYAVRRKTLPCPPWLIPLLENPFMEAVAGSTLLLNRAGVKPGMHILDVGCGPGRLTIPAAERVGPNGRVVGLDIQTGMLRRLEERLRRRGLANVQLIHAGASDGVIEQNRFDQAFLVTVLGEISDRTAALREIYAALKAGGLLSITEVLPDPHYQRQATVKSLAKEVGFQLDAQFGGIRAYTMHFRK